jgi:hypothetical protein
MNGLHEIRIACERLQGGRFITLEQKGQVMLLGLKVGELQPGYVILQVAPDPLDRVQLGAVGGQKEQTYILWQGQLGGGVRPTVVHHEDIQAVGEGLREGVDEELEHRGVQIGQFQKEAVARGRLHGAIDVEPLEDMLNGANRLHPTRGEAPAADGAEAEAAFVLAEHAYWAGLRRGDDLLEACPTSRLEGRNGLRVFLCDSGAPL